MLIVWKVKAGVNPDAQDVHLFLSPFVVHAPHDEWQYFVNSHRFPVALGLYPAGHVAAHVVDDGCK